MSVKVFIPEYKKWPLAVEAVERYTPRIKKYDSLTVQEFKTPKKGDPQYKKNQETQEILKRLDEKDFLVALDERGKGLSTVNLAEKIQKIKLDSSFKSLVFLVGGPYGLSEDILKRADLKLSLSPLVFNSEIAIVVLIEQVYRTLSYLSGHPYHNE